MKSQFKPRLVTVVQIGRSRYTRASDAASAWADFSASTQHSYRRSNGLRDIDWNDWHRRAFRRSLPIFERILGPSKNRKNPRTLISIDLTGKADVIDNT